tara:strand:+ start:2316 stop:2900 length:585 start_codon:yes stop_codon:yes gene_type:complete
MEKIEDELDNKSIERSPDEENITIKVEEQVDKKRTKKERSPAQIAAFEKARLKRQENYKKRQEQKTEATGPPLVGDQVDEITPEPRKPIKTQSTRKQALKSVDDYHDYQEPNISRQPIINNYYYGTNQYKSGNKKKSKKKVEIVEPSSDSEYTDSDEEYLPQQAKREIQKAPPTAKREKETIPQERVSLPFKFV